MKNIIYLLIVCSSIIFLSSCNKKLITSTTTIVKDSIVLKTHIDTVKVNVANDTLRFNTLIDSLLFLQEQLIQSKNKEDSLKLETKKKKVIQKLTKGVFSDTSFVINLYSEFKSNDSIYTKIDEITVNFENGNISHKLKSKKSVIPIIIETTNIKVENKITFWKWIKDEKTLILLLLFGIFIVVIKLIK